MEGGTNGTKKTKKTKGLTAILIFLIAVETIFLIISAVKGADAKKQAFTLRADLKQLKLDFSSKEETLKAQLDEVTISKADLEKKLAELTTSNKQLEIKLEEADKYVQLLKEDLQTQRKDILQHLDTFVSGSRDAEKTLLEKIGELGKINQVLQETIDKFSGAKEGKSLETQEMETIALERIVISPEEEAPFLSGKILDVNSRYGFVIIDLGEKEGMKPGLELPIFHREKEIGKVKVKEVYEHMSLANIVEEKTASGIRKADEARFTP